MLIFFFIISNTRHGRLAVEPSRCLIKVRRVLAGICARRGKILPQRILKQRYCNATHTEQCWVCLQEQQENILLSFFHM